MVGCSDAASDATPDPLADSWSNSECFGMSKPADIESCSTEITFTDDLEFELVAEWVSLAATADFPGCTTTRRITGQTWSTDHDAGTFTLSNGGVATLERANCVNEEDNQEPTEIEGFDVDAGDSVYDIQGDTLSVETGSLEGSYAR